MLACFLGVCAEESGSGCCPADPRWRHHHAPAVKGDFEYLVESTAVVSPDAIEVLRPTGRRTLTLITRFPFSFVEPAPNRFIVRARDMEPDRH